MLVLHVCSLSHESFSPTHPGEDVDPDGGEGEGREGWKEAHGGKTGEERVRKGSGGHETFMSTTQTCNNEVNASAAAL